jgi:hypothetical protein
MQKILLLISDALEVAPLSEKLNGEVGNSQYLWVNI